MAANDSPQMRTDFLTAMRNVANSVTVVTTDGPGGKQGATVSSFCSVSADPPTLLVCLNSDSRINKAVSQNKEFCVNVLPQGCDEIALKFAGVYDKDSPDRFSGIDVKADLKGSAVLANATSFSCTTEQEISSGSHVVFIGHVTEIFHGKQNPLIYLDGKFKKIQTD